MRTEMVRIPGGTFRMGSDHHYPEERPAHHVRVDAFWMDRHTVTNAEFTRFVSETGYVTVAERELDPTDYPGADREVLVPGSLVFHMTDGPVDLHDVRNWWSYLPGACWRHPMGRDSDLTGLANHPVVQVAYEDAEAYAAWAGKQLPTEAEWEFAARGGLDGAEFTWGDTLAPDGRHMANTWQGPFPWRNFAADGHEGTAPVGTYPANGFGLYDMTGNVWEWTADWWAPAHVDAPIHSCCAPENPRGPGQDGSYDPLQPRIRIPRKVLKGGSFLCAPNYCRRYRPAARHAQMIDTATNHIGFRCIQRD